MPEIQLTIIIPVFNDFASLTNLLSALVVHPQLNKSVEIIVVDDGSTVDISSIISRYPDVRFFRQKNLKQGAARNNGLRHARGRYVWFIDSDDMVADSAIDQILYNIRYSEFDIIYFKSDYRGALLHSYIPHASKNTNLYLMARGALSVAPWNKIFRCSFLVDNKLLFVENRKYEDLFFTIAAVYLSKSTGYIDDVLYSYSFNPLGTTKLHNKSVVDVYHVFLNLYDFFIENSEMGQVERKVLWLVYYAHVTKYTLIRIVESRNPVLLLHVLTSSVFWRSLRSVLTRE